MIEKNVLTPSQTDNFSFMEADHRQSKRGSVPYRPLRYKFAFKSFKHL